MCIGAGGALVFLFFLVSGLLSGEIFPQFGADEAAGKQIALLVVWCFIAGFSEKLVTGLLSQSEGRGLGVNSERQPGEVSRPQGTTGKPSKEESDS